MRKTFNTFIMAFVSTIPLMGQDTVTELRTLGLNEPIGIESTPTFSWKINSDQRGIKQGTYEISVTDNNGNTVWNSGKRESTQQTDVPYEGPSLESRQKYNWTVSVTDQKGNSLGDGQSCFETGILTQEEWSNAEWIAAKRQPYKAIVEITPTDGSVNARYVKLKVTASGPHASSDPNYGFVQIAEIEIYNKEGKNVAREAKFTASNAWELTNYGWSIRYINDGVITGGSTNGFTTTQNVTSTDIVADLGQAEEIARLVLYPRQDAPAMNDDKKAANFPSSYSIETGLTSADYTIIYQVEKADAPSYTDDTNVPYFGCNFNVSEEKTVAYARLYASALGVFTTRLNGKLVTDNVLEPGESAYNAAGT